MPLVSVFAPVSSGAFFLIRVLIRLTQVFELDFFLTRYTELTLFPPSIYKIKIPTVMFSVFNEYAVFVLNIYRLVIIRSAE